MSTHTVKTLFLGPLCLRLHWTFLESISVHITLCRSLFTHHSEVAKLNGSFKERGNVWRVCLHDRTVHDLVLNMKNLLKCLLASLHLIPPPPPVFTQNKLTRSLFSLSLLSFLSPHFPIRKKKTKEPKSHLIPSYWVALDGDWVLWTLMPCHFTS